MVRGKSRFDSQIYQRSVEAIAHGALTNSKRPQSFVKGIYPTHLTRGQGCRVWDTQGNEYIDFIAGLGSNLFGYANADLTEAIQRQIQHGTTLSLGTEIEVKCAERIKEFFPFAERVRFLKTGSEACTAALIMARAYSHRDSIYSEGYHGWHPEFTSLTPPANGCTRQPYIHKMHDGVFDADAGAVILEPVITDASQKRNEMVKGLVDACRNYNIVTIFDEIITGFRWPGYSVAEAWGVTPDLICLGKACAGGLPLSIVAGKKAIMDSDYFVSSTFAGDTAALAACLKTMDLLQNKFRLEFLWEKGAQFLERFNNIWNDGLTIEGYPTRGVFKGDEIVKALFMQECCRAGILVGPSFFFNFSHLDIADEVLSTFQDILLRIQRKEVELIGEMPQKPFAQKIRGQ